MPGYKDIKAKNAAFAASARENAGKPRIRSTSSSSSKNAAGDSESVDGETYESKRQNQRRGRNIVKPARKDRTLNGASGSAGGAIGGGLKNNKWALALIVFVVIGGVFFELMRLFL